MAVKLEKWLKQLLNPTKVWIFRSEFVEIDDEKMKLDRNTLQKPADDIAKVALGWNPQRAP